MLNSVFAQRPSLLAAFSSTAPRARALAIASLGQPSCLAFKLIEEAEKTRQKIRGADKIDSLLRAVPFKDGIAVQDNPPTQQKRAA